MGSIVGEKHRNATGSGWAVSDKIFGYVNQLSADYRTIKMATLYPGDPGYEEQQRRAQYGLFGLPVPLGAFLLIGGLGLTAYFVYNLVTKK
jgi:hypothetical protein